MKKETKKIIGALETYEEIKRVHDKIASNASTKNGVKLLSRDYIIALLELNTLLQPKAHLSNDVIIQILNKLPSSFSIGADACKGGIACNRGIIIECAIRAFLTGEMTQFKALSHKADLNTINLSPKMLKLVNNIKCNNIDIKFTTSYAPATNNTSGASIVMLVSTSGIYLIDSDKIQYTKAGKLNINNQKMNDLTPLNDLMDLLGF